MTDYGQGIAPRWYKDSTPRQCTKTNFAWHMHRALMQVGMIPIRSWNPFDLELPAYEDFNPGSAQSGYIWYYDFPTTETFTIDGVPYRPVICMVMHIAVTGSVASASEANSAIRFEYGYRRADRLNRDDFSNIIRLHTSTTNFGVGVQSDALSFGANLSYGSMCGLGACYTFAAWKTYSGSADANRQTLQPIGNIHVILSSGGLVVQVGTGTSKTDSNDILSFSVVFGGARVPGRARIPASDPNLNRINPAFILPHRVSALDAGVANYWISSLSYEDLSYSAVRPCSWALGVQHDLKVARGSQSGYTTRPGAVRLEIFNLENIQRPIFPSPKAPTQNSPRAYNGGGAHILQPIVYTQSSLKTNDNDYYQVQNFDLRSQICPEWEDIWYCPNFRFADRTAPYGEYVDPVTGTNWFVFRAEGINSMMATNVEGVTKFTSFDISTTFNLIDTDYFNLNGGFTWTAGNPAEATASQTQGAGLTQAWTATPSTDEATAIHDANNAGSSTWTFVVTNPYTVSSATSFTLQMELRWFSPNAQSNSTSNAMFIEYTTDDGTTWTTLQTIYNTGNSAIPYNSYTMTSELPIFPGALDGKIRFRLRCTHSSTVGGNRTVAVRNIRIRQYERS